MSEVHFHGVYYHLYQCSSGGGHYHILSRTGEVSQPCWSKPALIGLIRDLRMLIPDACTEVERVNRHADLAGILSMVNAFANKRNRVGGKIAKGYVLPRDWQLGEQREVPRDWKEFRSGRASSIAIPTTLFGGDFQTLAPLHCDFVGRTESFPERGTVGMDEVLRLARLPATIIGQEAVGIEWSRLEDED